MLDYNSFKILCTCNWKSATQKDCDIIENLLDTVCPIAAGEINLVHPAPTNLHSLKMNYHKKQPNKNIVKCYTLHIFLLQIKLK